MTQTASTKFLIVVGLVLFGLAVAYPAAPVLAVSTVFHQITGAADWLATSIKHLVA